MRKILWLLLLTACSGAAHAAISVGGSAQCAAHANVCTTATTTTAATGSSYVVEVQYPSVVTISSVGDSLTNTYTQVGSTVVDSSDGTSVSVYQCTNCTGGASFTWNVHVSATTDFAIIGLEITGGATTSLVDVNAGCYLTGGKPFSCPVTTTNANDLLLSFIGVNAEPTTPSSTNFPNNVQVYSDATTGLSGAANYVVESSTGAYDPNWTQTGTHTLALVFTLGLKSATGGASCTHAGITSAGAIATPNGTTGSYQGKTGSFVTPDCSTVNYKQPAVGNFGVN